MKTCTKCGQSKPFTEYHKQKGRPFGLRYACKVCVKEYGTAQYDKNHNAQRCKAYRNANRDRMNAISSKRRAAKLQATPPWLTQNHLDEIELCYTEALALRVYSGQEYHVDHIVPLQGKTVCGLHVPWNLRVIPAKDNLSKSNRLEI